MRSPATLHLAGVPALVHNPRPPEVTDDGRGKPALYRDGVDSLVELADPLPPAHPAVLWSAGRYHALADISIIIITTDIRDISPQN